MLKCHFTEDNLRRVRRMQFILPVPCAWTHGLLDSTLWSLILANLTKLTIVTHEPPIGWPYYGNPYPIEQILKKWTEWLGVAMQYIGHQLPRGCIVEIDDDDSKETSALMKEKEHFPHGYQKVQTPKDEFGLDNVQHHRAPRRLKSDVYCAHFPTLVPAV